MAIFDGKAKLFHFADARACLPFGLGGASARDLTRPPPSGDQLEPQKRLTCLGRIPPPRHHFSSQEFKQRSGNLRNPEVSERRRLPLQTHFPGSSASNFQNRCQHGFLCYSPWVLSKAQIASVTSGPYLRPAPPDLVGYLNAATKQSESGLPAAHSATGIERNRGEEA